MDSPEENIFINSVSKRRYSGLLKRSDVMYDENIPRRTSLRLQTKQTQKSYGSDVADDLFEKFAEMAGRRNSNNFNNTENTTNSIKKCTNKRKSMKKFKESDNEESETIKKQNVKIERSTENDLVNKSDLYDSCCQTALKDDDSILKNKKNLQESVIITDKEISTENRSLPKKRKSEKNSNTEHNIDLNKIYLDKSVKRLPSTFETIFEEPVNELCMGKRKFKRFLVFGQDQASNLKQRKRKLKLKKLFRNNINTQKLPDHVFENKLKELEDL